jgi:nicotinate phosphoribosyltransferase
MKTSAMRHYSDSALLTDLYEVAMLQAYFANRMNDTAAFEFFVRRLPDERNFLVAAGLEQVVTYLSTLHFDEDDLAWLAASKRFDSAFLDSLRDFRFTGGVDAFPEGTVFFAEEPILRVTAPLREAQFVESRVMNLLHFQTLVASKAARCVLAADGRRLIDFGLRRAHGAEAAVLAARASYVAGFDGTATTAAARLFGIPASGTMAHSFVQAHDTESESFASFAQAFPNDATLLIDTYDTEAAAEEVVRMAHRLREQQGIHIKAVRIDSGNLETAARNVRRIFDAGGCPEIGIVVSGNLDERTIATLVEHGAPIDGFGIGTRMNTSCDAPYLDCAYKLVEYAGQPRRKRSQGKANWPGRKQIFRCLDTQGIMAFDVLMLEGHDRPDGEALLQPVMRHGAIVSPLPALTDIRLHALTQLAALPLPLQSLDPAKPAYPVEITPPVRELAQQVDARRHAQSRESQ